MSENERKGFLVLLVIIVAAAVVPRIYIAYVGKHAEDIVYMSISEKAEADEYFQPQKDEEHSTTDALKQKDDHWPTKYRLFPFNPNGLPVEKWQELGFTDKQIRVIKNYEAKGGRFSSKADLAKVYSISDRDLERIGPYLVFEEPRRPTPAAVRERAYAQSPKKKLLIDLNTADTTALKELRGIGSVLATRIVKFRDGLGGFHRVDQLREVYGISDDLFSTLQPYLQIKDSTIKQLAINKLTEDELASHPYVSKKMASLLFRYREQHGDFRSLSDLRRMYAVDPEFLRKIEPYLKFN